jgi:hypothetical protein
MFRKEEKGLLNDGSGCQLHSVAFVKTPFFLRPMQHHAKLKWGVRKI